MCRSIYIAKAEDDAPSIEVGRATAWAIGLCVAGIIVMGVLPNTFLSPAQDAAKVVSGEAAQPSVPTAQFMMPQGK